MSMGGKFWLAKHRRAAKRNVKDIPIPAQAIPAHGGETDGHGMEAGVKGDRKRAALQTALGYRMCRAAYSGMRST